MGPGAISVPNKAQRKPSTTPTIGLMPYRVRQGSASRLLVEHFTSPFQVKLLVAGKVEAHRAVVQMVWDAG
jgi:hypothetical protein